MRPDGYFPKTSPVSLLAMRSHQSSSNDGNNWRRQRVDPPLTARKQESSPTSLVLHSSHEAGEEIPWIPPVERKCRSAGFHTNKNRSRWKDRKHGGQGDCWWWRSARPRRVPSHDWSASAPMWAWPPPHPFRSGGERSERSLQMMPLVCLLNHCTPCWKLISEVQWFREQSQARFKSFFVVWIVCPPNIVKNDETNISLRL